MRTKTPNEKALREKLNALAEQQHELEREQSACFTAYLSTRVAAIKEGREVENEPAILTAGQAQHLARKEQLAHQHAALEPAHQAELRRMRELEEANRLSAA